MHIYICVWTHNSLWPIPLTPCWWTYPCMLHRPAPQIISRSVTSVTAVGLPSNCTTKFTNPILTNCFTNRTICVCLTGCDVGTCPFSGFGFQKISFSITAVYFTDRAKCKTLLPFTHHQTLDGGFCCHTRCGSLVKMTSCSLQYPSSKPTGLDLPKRNDVATWLCRRGILFSILKTVQPFCLSFFIHFTRHVPSYNVEFVSKLRLGIWIIFHLFLFKHAKQLPKPSTPTQTLKQIQENYCVVVLSGKGLHITKYRNIEMCSTGHVLAIQ
jgi:hypothetical protein